jgi:ribosome biogenesis GTPase / thiamine phosphate phosphatase
MTAWRGTVIKSTGSWYLVEDDLGQKHRARLRGKFKLTLEDRKLSNPIAVGDRVTLQKTEGGEDTVTITEIVDRQNYLVRKSVHRAAQSHILAANLDQVLLVATLTMPRTSMGFIDRFLVSAEAYRIPGVIVLNKADLLDEQDKELGMALEVLYGGLGYGFLLCSATEGMNLEELHHLLDGKTTLIAGHSGVGKSSLINALVPGLAIRVGEVSTFANKGTHTTTFAERHELWAKTYIIDTPGIKELGLAEIEAAELGHYFPEMRKLMGGCKYNNCRHVNEPGCAVLAGLETGEIWATRYESYLSMLAGDDNRR